MDDIVYDDGFLCEEKNEAPSSVAENEGNVWKKVDL